MTCSVDNITADIILFYLFINIYFQWNLLIVKQIFADFIMNDFNKMKCSAKLKSFSFFILML